LASKAYTARTVEQLRAGIEQIADELLDGIDRVRLGAPLT